MREFLWDPSLTRTGKAGSPRCTKRSTEDVDSDEEPRTSMVRDHRRIPLRFAVAKESLDRVNLLLQVDRARVRALFDLFMR